MDYKSSIMVVFAVLLSVCLTGCFSANPENLQYFTRPDGKDVTMDDPPYETNGNVTPVSGSMRRLPATIKILWKTR